MAERVGFMGLGAIGRPIARHVAQRFETVVWNRTAAKAQEFARATGAKVADSPGALVKQVDVVMTCLPTSREVWEVAEAAGAAWRAGQVLIDATSGDPFTSRELAKRLAASKVGFVDAPVSGGTAGAEAGKLTVMVGGDEQWVARARPIIEVYAVKIVHVGAVGTGHATKAVNNALLAVNLIAVGEALVALVKSGVSARTAVEVLNASSGRSFVSEVLVPERVLTGRWPQTFRLALLDKDVGIARTFLHEAGVEGPMLELAGQLLSQARAELGEAADHVEAIRLIERRAGVEIRG